MTPRRMGDAFAAARAHDDACDEILRILAELETTPHDIGQGEEWARLRKAAQEEKGP